MKENIGLNGHFRIVARDAETGKVLRKWDIDNQLTAYNARVRSQMLSGAYSGEGLQIKYFAVGTGITPPTANDTSLVYEVFRKQVTSVSMDDDYTVTSIVSFSSNDANYHIKEVGVFCGTSATASANTGILLSRILFDFDKNSNVVLDLIRTDTVIL